jgi:hypothetical protein
MIATIAGTAVASFTVIIPRVQRNTSSKTFMLKRHRWDGHPSAPATPRYMGVRVRRFRGLRITIEQARETNRIEVSDRKRVRQGWTVRQMPRAVWAARRY